MGLAAGGRGVVLLWTKGPGRRGVPVTLGGGRLPSGRATGQVLRGALPGADCCAQRSATEALPLLCAQQCHRPSPGVGACAQALLVMQMECFPTSGHQRSCGVTAGAPRPPLGPCGGVLPVFCQSAVTIKPVFLRIVSCEEGVRVCVRACVCRGWGASGTAVRAQLGAQNCRRGETRRHTHRGACAAGPGLSVRPVSRAGQQPGPAASLSRQETLCSRSPRGLEWASPARGESAWVQETCGFVSYQ